MSQLCEADKKHRGTEDTESTSRLCSVISMPLCFKTLAARPANEALNFMSPKNS